MMKLLLHDSQESQISPITHVSETGGESLKTLPCTKAPSTAADTHPEASESNVETETDSQTTETQSESQHTSVPPTEESQSQSSPETNRESSTDEKLNESSISSSSQAAETRDQTSNDVVDQDEFLAKVLKKCQQRVLLKPHTKNPRLWRHSMDPRPALCRLHAVDDGVRLAATGIVWAVGPTDWQVILCANLGWETKERSRSHSVVSKGPTFVFVRRAELAGTPVQFRHLKKFPVTTLFREGHVHATVNQSLVAREVSLCHSFLKDNDDDIQNWMAVNVVKLVNNKHKSSTHEADEEATITIKTRPLKRSRRLRELEAKQLVKMKRETEKIKLQNQRNSQRLQQQQKRREMEQDMKKTAATEVKNCLQAFRSDMEKSLNAVQKKCSRVVSNNLTKSVTKTVDKALLPTMRFIKKQEKALQKYRAEQAKHNLQQEKMLDELSGRFEDLIEEFEKMSSVIQEVTKWKRSVSKKMKKFEKSMENLRAVSKQLEARLDEHEARVKRERDPPKKKRRKRKVTDNTNENENVAPPQVPAVVQSQHHIVSRPPTPMVASIGPPGSAMSPSWWGSRTANGMSNVGQPRYTGTPRPDTVSGSQTHFVSPVFASRNFVR